jgi:hypothetical protein
MGEVPALAKRRGISVTLGAWLDTDRARNEREIEQAIRLAKEHRNVVRIMVGNEVLLRGDLSRADLVAHLEHVRSATRQPVSTAEPWHVWMLYPELAEHVDYIAVHMLPYWEGVEVEVAVDYVIDKMALLERTFPGKEIVIGEVGWPSAGRTRESAVATTSNQALFLRRFLDRATQEGYVYYVMEAFDQPWKERSEGKVGAYWGVYDADREQKFAFTTSKSWSSTTTPSTRWCGSPSRSTAGGSVRDSVSSMSTLWRASRRARSISRCATPTRAPKSLRSSTPTTWCSRAGCATSCRPSPPNAPVSSRRRRTTATLARVRSRPCAMRSTGASFTSAWSRATSATRSSSTAR